MLYESFNFINIGLENGLLLSKPLSGWCRDAYRYTIRGTGTTFYWSKVSKWHAQNDIFIDTNICKFGSSNHKRPVHSNNLRTFRKGTLPWQSMWRSPLLLPLRIITVQAVVVGHVRCSWLQVAAFLLRTVCVYRNMDRFDIGIKMWYIIIGIDIEKNVTICIPIWTHVDLKLIGLQVYIYTCQVSVSKTGWLACAINSMTKSLLLLFFYDKNYYKHFINRATCIG